MLRDDLPSGSYSDPFRVHSLENAQRCSSSRSKCFLRCFCTHLSSSKTTRKSLTNGCCGYTSPSCLSLFWRVFCGPWIKLHDAETLGGQTGGSTHSAARGGRRVALVLPLVLLLFFCFFCQRVFCRAEMTSSRFWVRKLCAFCLAFTLLLPFSQMVRSSSWAHIYFSLPRASD